MPIFPRSFFLLLPMMVCCFLASAQNTAPVKLSGTFRESRAGNGISGVVVAVLETAAAIAMTDSAGQFSLTLLPGTYTIRLAPPAAPAQALTLTLRGDTSIAVIAEEEKISGRAIEEVVVTSNTARTKMRSTQVGLEYIDRKTAQLLPAILGEVDIIKVFQLKPGVKNSGEGTSGISVRGGGTDQNLFLLDGTPVYNPAHLFGFFSTFNIDAVKDVQLYKAGFPAEYSGRLSSIVAVNSATGGDTARFGGGGGIGLIASRLNLQGNLLRGDTKGRKLTYNLAARRTYADVGTRALNRAAADDPAYNPIPDYYFYDANARVDFQLSERDAVYGSFYYGRDFFDFGSGTFSSTFSWGNTAASLHWKRNNPTGLNSELSLHLSDYNYDLTSSFDRFGFQLGSGVREYSVQQKLMHRGLGRHLLGFGWSAGYTTFSVARFDISSSKADESLSSGEELSGTEGGVYLSDEWTVNAGLSVNAGARFTIFSNGATYAGLEPRISIRQMIGEHVSLKGSYARMQQYKHLVASSGASLPTDIWYPSTRGIRPEISDQASLGVSWNIGKGILLTNEAYYKWMRQLVDYRPGANLLVNSALEDEFVSGTGVGYGNEITIEKTAGKLRGWIGYTWARTTRSFADINDGKPFFPRYDRRHELTVVAMYPLSKRITASGSWTFYTGNAVSLPTGRTIEIDAPGTKDASTLFSLTPVYPERGNYRMPNYHRLDLSLVYKLGMKRGSRSDLTFSAYNAYSRLNPYFISFVPREGNSNAVAGTPQGFAPRAVTLFPIIPSVTYNFRF